MADGKMGAILHPRHTHAASQKGGLVAPDLLVPQTHLGSQIPLPLRRRLVRQPRDGHVVRQRRRQLLSTGAVELNTRYPLGLLNELHHGVFSSKGSGLKWIHLLDVVDTEEVNLNDSPDFSLERTKFHSTWERRSKISL